MSSSELYTPGTLLRVDKHAKYLSSIVSPAVAGMLGSGEAILDDIIVSYYGADDRAGGYHIIQGAEELVEVFPASWHDCDGRLAAPTGRWVSAPVLLRSCRPIDNIEDEHDEFEISYYGERI